MLWASFRTHLFDKTVGLYYEYVGIATTTTLPFTEWHESLLQSSGKDNEKGTENIGGGNRLPEIWPTSRRNEQSIGDPLQHTKTVKILEQSENFYAIETCTCANIGKTER